MAASSLGIFVSTDAACTATDARKPPRSCWIINDTPDGKIFSHMRSIHFEVTRLVDNRTLNGTRTMLRQLVADLQLARPSLITGILKAPATTIGTEYERNVSESIAALISDQLAASGSVLLVGPCNNRFSSQPGLRELIAGRSILQSQHSWCCLGVKAGGKLVNRQHMVISDFAIAPRC